MEPRTIFQVFGPRDVPTYRGKAGRTITDDGVRDFWRRNADVAFLRGCYVFAMRVGTSLRPAYVGKATRAFRREVFQYHKLTRYQQELADARVGMPVVFFVALPRRRGAPPTAQVANLERFLIDAAAVVNPDLLNARGVVQPAWAIHGVVRRASGKPSASALSFRRLMRFTR